jgi:glycogen synthase
MEMADAIVAVSAETRADVLKLFNVREDRIRIIYNGIDPDEYKLTSSTTTLKKYGVDPAVPYVLFVGRITRQKGIVHLVNAIKYMDAGYQVVLCAGAPDTKEIAAEMRSAVDAARKGRSNVIWIDEMVDKQSVYELYSHAAVFCCPSIYEPFGIINLEAMACETAVVASAVGGIKEVVAHGETGFLVPLKQMQDSPFEPVNPDQFSRDLAARINELMADPELRKRFGKAGRARAIEKFSWAEIARQTKALYESLAR